MGELWAQLTHSHLHLAFFGHTPSHRVMNTIAYTIISQGLNSPHGTSSRYAIGFLTILVLCTK